MVLFAAPYRQCLFFVIMYSYFKNCLHTSLPFVVKNYGLFLVFRYYLVALSIWCSCDFESEINQIHFFILPVLIVDVSLSFVDAGSWSGLNDLL